MLGFSTDILPVSELVCSQLAVIRSISYVKINISMHHRNFRTGSLGELSRFNRPLIFSLLLRIIATQNSTSEEMSSENTHTESSSFPGTIACPSWSKNADL